MNYSSNDNSLPLKSTSNSSSSRPFTKRELHLFFNGGEGMVINNNGPELICSAGFSMINTRNTTIQYLLTSARCIPETQNPQEIFYSPWHPPFPEQLAFYYFGRVSHTQRTGVDFALIEKLEGTFKLSPMVRTSMQEYPIVPIGNIDLVTLLPVGHHICKSGYDTHSWCGEIHMINSDFYSAGYGRITDDNTYIELVGYGICTYDYLNVDLGIVITPLSNIINFRDTRRFFSNLEFINSNNLGLLP
ncbi:23180_t:CDS:2 [Gigaspora margarita]|uniref:23180_t:CDS:1 n=1 Tax=Gigaspora margarita TaxID=4874 RepID=A0ABN7X576_GIGMA|nr:23180_t:CDS:2 [Gigaspora margarita]